MKMSKTTLSSRVSILQFVGLVFFSLTVNARSITPRHLSTTSLDAVRIESEQARTQTEIFQQSKLVDNEMMITEPPNSGGPNCRCSRRLVKRGKKDVMWACLLCKGQNPMNDSPDINNLARIVSKGVSAPRITESSRRAESALLGSFRASKNTLQGTRSIQYRPRKSTNQSAAV